MKGIGTTLLVIGLWTLGLLSELGQARPQNNPCAGKPKTLYVHTYVAFDIFCLNTHCFHV